MKSVKVLLILSILVLAFSPVISATETMTMPDLLPAPDVITTFGPDGEVATWYSEVKLTPEEVEKVRSMNVRAAYEQVTECEWSSANLNGFKDACEFLNIDIVGIASAELDPIRQKTNMETFIGLDPDFITCQPQDLDLAASTFDLLVDRGIKLVFLSNVPTGYEPGKQYVSALTDSLYDMGKDGAEMIADAIGGEGKILTITVAGVNYVCNTRDGAFKEVIEKKYPDIEIINGGFQKMSEAGDITSGLVTRYPDVKGIYVSFSGPAIYVLEALKGLGRDDIKLVTLDLDSVIALDMVQGGNTYGIGIDLAYSMGYGRAMLGAYGVLNKPAPKYVTSPSFKVTKDNIEEGWKRTMGEELPEDIKDAIK